MRRAFLLLAFTVGILATALAVVLVLALLPYLGIIGLVAMGLLVAAGAGLLVLGLHHVWDSIARKHIAREKAHTELALLERELDYVRPNEYGHVTAIRTGDGGYRYTPLMIEAPAAALRHPLPSPRTEQESEVAIPHAPAFPEMCHLISPGRLVLCYTQHGPAYGSIEDLLSMAIVGKPGRGKTTALLYYLAMLLNARAEVHVWDPHGSMNELAACHPNLYYTDRLGDISASLAYLEQELEVRDALYKQGKQVKYPLLLLVDELPVIGDYEETLKKTARKDNLPLPTHLIKRFVLEGRKWRCFFIASGQSTDAEILPTRVTENLSSRIIFFSSDRRARMAGLEQEAVKKFLPVIRRAGSGVMIFDCSSWDEPVLGAIPETTVEDLQDFLFGGPRLLHAPGEGEGFHQTPTIPFSRKQTRAGSLMVPGNVRNASQPQVSDFPAFPTSAAKRAETLKDEADMGLLPEMSGRPGSPSEVPGDSPRNRSRTPEDESGRSGTPPGETRNGPKTKAISRELHTRIKAEYDKGTPKSEVCGKLRIGNDYYPTIRAMYQQFDLEKQRRPRKTGLPQAEREE